MNARDGKRALVVVLGVLFVQSLLVSPLGSPTPAAAATFGDGSPFPGPLPMALPASGGLIQAENFNRGAPEQAFHACTPGNQGNDKSYRPGAHDVDVSRGGSSLYITSSTLHASSNPAHNCARAPFLSDYVKYSFTVAQTGWYALVGIASNGRLWTRVNDVNVGATRPIGGWSNVMMARAVRLVAGRTNVLAVELLGVRTALDAVRVMPIQVHFPAPRAVSAPLTTDTVVVADAVVTDAQFGVVRNRASADARPGIQQALNTVGAKGGGTVFLPPGMYTLRGPLFIPPNVTLRGDWSPNPAQPGQTILAANVHPGKNGTPFINLFGNNAVVSHLAVWYPKQSFTRPKRYPPTIGSNSPSVTVDSVTLYNSDLGVVYRAGSAADISNLKATCFTTCIVDDGNLEFSFITNITIGNGIWASGPASIRNKPRTAAHRAALQRWTAKHLTGIRLYRNDNLTIYGVRVRNARRGIVTTRTNCRPACGTYGSLSKISATLDRRGDAPTSRARRNVNSIMHTDRVVQARKIAHQFPPARKAARTGPSAFYDAQAAPFSAQADGFTDDTGAIQGALNAAAAGGGGTVYLPSGTYLVSSRLTVPSGVELRGSYAARHTSETIDATTLLAVDGEGTASPNSYPAFISLQSSAGVRGVTIRYPNQGFGSVTYPVVPFPYTFRTLGAKTWLQDVNVLNGYQVADLTTYRSDAFVVKNLWATAFATGVNMGGGSNTGWLDRSVISFGSLYQSRHSNSPHDYGRAAIANYTRKHLVAYYLGDVSGFRSLGAMSFNAWVHFATYRGAGAGPTRATIFASSADSAASTGFRLGAGNKIAFVGMLARAVRSPVDVTTMASFGGVASISDAALSSKRPIVRRGGTLRVYRER